MKIDIFYHDKFKFSFERDLSEIYLDRIKSIPKSIISSINCKKINTKELTKIVTEYHKKSVKFLILSFLKICQNLVWEVNKTESLIPHKI